MPIDNDPKHDSLRSTLRAVGPVIVGIGVIFAAIGIGNFFMSFGSFEPPRYFWCAFIGLPLIGLGTAICKFAYMGAITRYMANEVSPVGKDVVNYMADGTQDAARGFATAIGEGLRGSAQSEEKRILRCHKCNHDNDESAKFCKDCGTPLTKSQSCAACGELNDPDAKFCDNCGKPMGT